MGGDGLVEVPRNRGGGVNDTEIELRKGRERIACGV